MFAATQAEFAGALLDPERSMPDGVTSHSARHPQKRFAVYRNNVIAGLVNALRSKFPATQRIVGEEFFAAMARVFVTLHPPRSKILHRYGDYLGDFIVGFEPVAELPYLADIARLEAARTRAYHAADATPLPADAFAAIDPRRIGVMRVVLHPSLEILRSRHPVVTIWSMNAGETKLASIDDAMPEDALILRPHLDVIVRQLPPGGATFLLALSSGLPLQHAAALALDENTGFDLTANLAGLIGSGAAIGYSLNDKD